MPVSMCRILISGGVQDRQGRLRIQAVGRGSLPVALPLGSQSCAVALNLGFRMTLPECGCLFCDLLTLGPWENYLHFLNFSFLICKMGTIIAPTFQDYWEGQRS